MAAEYVDPGAQFLHERDRALHKSTEVAQVVGYLRSHGTRISQSPAEKIGAYVSFLADPEYVNDGLLTGDMASAQRQLDISAVDIPETIDDPEQREQQEMVRLNQLTSLGPWMRCLNDNRPGFQNWFRLYAFNEVRKLCPYDYTTDTMARRDTNTYAPFPELNERALVLTYIYLRDARMHGLRVAGGYADASQETIFQRDLKNAHFRGLYMHALKKIGVGRITDEMKAVTGGFWRLYPKDSDATDLYSAQQGFGLGWCTATGYGSAKHYLSTSDLHVFYTRGSAFQERIPRLTVVTDLGAVSEARGVERDQEVEVIMLDTLERKLAELPCSDTFRERIASRRKLHDIQVKTTGNENVRLTPSELAFLFELNKDIETFGHRRSGEIKRLRTRHGPEHRQLLRKMLPEAVYAQLGSAAIAYNELCNTLQRKPIQTRVLKKLFRTRFKDWSERGLFDYAANRLAAGGHSYNLVISPNGLASHSKLSQAVSRLSYGRTDNTSDILTARLYTPAELAGNRGNHPVRFSLIGTGLLFDHPRSIEEARSHIADLQRHSPRIRFGAPSVLDAIAYWYAIRAGGNELVNNQNGLSRTAVSHFTMRHCVENKGDYTTSVIPFSYIGIDAGLTVVASVSVEEADALSAIRLAIS
ncbi:MAG TPA: hypothetical protein VLI54_07340 [Bacillota bacterium]|nr:hypothetical protein [Bacillota bacterium]